ncbi:MAG: hypothetical protein GDA39_03560 [Hyphomonadaceae bacterium]|nr:hypothetical protein [Hyphomonadaceae bacterium]MBC6412024.1 hypothetical protein [Hyphomonadaceae bacterium]
MPQTSGSMAGNATDCALVEQALHRIASVDVMDGRALVRMPVMYPSGANCSVEVETNKDTCRVSDMGFGLVEAEYTGATEYYAKAARDASQACGTEFDGNAVVALGVPVSRLESAIVCVANASNQAAHEAIRIASDQKSRRRNGEVFDQAISVSGEEHVAESADIEGRGNATRDALNWTAREAIPCAPARQSRRESNDEVFDRVIRVFGEESVAKSAEIKGRSTAWKAHNVVTLPSRHLAIFEYMTEHHNSVSNKFFMFSDIRKAHETISLNAVVADVALLGPKTQIVADVANLISINAGEVQYRHYAEALRTAASRHATDSRT